MRITIQSNYFKPHGLSLVIPRQLVTKTLQVDCEISEKGLSSGIAKAIFGELGGPGGIATELCFSGSDAFQRGKEAAFESVFIPEDKTAFHAIRFHGTISNIRTEEDFEEHGTFELVIGEVYEPHAGFGASFHPSGIYPPIR